jgi:4-diphosphocytidyl-2-C-methyl-D-erythritol kinase
MTDRVTLDAPAKLNLFLRVLTREADGHHCIETLFCRVGLSDTLVAERRSGKAITLEVTGADCGSAEGNLAVRAARMVLEATGHRFGVHLSLTKRIPVGAGLGGGSSDGAASLLAVNGLAGQAVPRHELLQFAARLGADVPFLFSGAPLALAWGRGERLFALPALPPAPTLLVSPPVQVLTAEAYRWVDQVQSGRGLRGSVRLDAGALGTWGNIGRLAGNDFEGPVFGRHPSVRAAFEALAATGPLLCRMTGSGATLFAVYRDGSDRDAAVARLGTRHGEVIATETASE